MSWERKSLNLWLTIQFTSLTTIFLSFILYLCMVSIAFLAVSLSLNSMILHENKTKIVLVKLLSSTIFYFIEISHRFVSLTLTLLIFHLEFQTFQHTAPHQLYKIKSKFQHVQYKHSLQMIFKCLQRTSVGNLISFPFGPIATTLAKNNML